VDVTGAAGATQSAATGFRSASAHLVDMHIESAEAILPYFENIRARTLRVVALIPRDRIDWTHRAGAFTLGDIVRHLAATERWMFAENVRGRPSRYPGHGRELADGFDAVLAYFGRMHEESMLIFRELTLEELRTPVETPAGKPIVAWKWLRAMVEHEVHHRGQLYLMLGMLGVATPPIYGLTSEQVRERSIHE
jgi:uncharacterized damage-inducible protein DinB